MKSQGKVNSVFTLAIAVCLVAVVSANAAWAQVVDVPIVTESAKLVSNEPGAEYSFGYTVATNGDGALVGNMYAGFVDGVQSGNVSYFEKSADNEWLNMTEIGPTDPTKKMHFGSAIAIDNSFAVIGAPNDRSHAFGTGSAYVFENVGNGVWVERAKLLGDGPNVWNFGKAVGISGDTIVVGGSELVYIFTKDGNSWPLTEILMSGEASRDYFGNAVAIEGDVLVLGASNGTGFETESGVAYVYLKKEDRSWAFSQKLSSPQALYDGNFGFSVDVSHDTIVIGAPTDTTLGDGGAGAAYVFRRSVNGSWIEEEKLFSPVLGRVQEDYGWDFGSDVAADGDVIYICQDEPYLDARPGGLVYVYRRRAEGVWEPLARMTASDSIEADYFGIDMDFTGGTAIVASVRLGARISSTGIFCLFPVGSISTSSRVTAET